MKTSIYNLTINSLLLSLFLLFTLVPWLGFLPFGVFKITLMPILFLISIEILNLTTKTNLIICGLLYGLLFGLSSLIQSVLYPSATAFLFVNPLFSIVPRILMGAATGLIAFSIQKINSNSITKKIFLAFIATTFNTLFVFLFVYNLGPIIYLNQNQEIFKLFSWMILVTNYLPELILTSLIYPPVALALKRIY